MKKALKKEKQAVTVVVPSFGSVKVRAGAELGQAQLKLGLDFTFCRFGFS